MALQFVPPNNAIIQEYLNRKTPYEEAAIGVQTGLQNYLAIDEAKRRNMTQQREWDQREQMLGLKQAEMGYDPNNPSAYWDRFNADREMKRKLNESQEKENLARADYYNRMPNPGIGSPEQPTDYYDPATGEKKFSLPPGGKLIPATVSTAGTKEAEKAEKEKGLKQAAIDQADTVMHKIDQAIGNVGGMTTGVGGSLMGMVPGTKAVDLQKDIDTVKANLGFSTLQEMRRNSPTGGALGQVAVQELNMLQSTVASLDRSQSGEQLKRNLLEVKKHYQNWKDAVSGNTPSSNSGGGASSLPQVGGTFQGGRVLSVKRKS